MPGAAPPTRGPTRERSRARPTQESSMLRSLVFLGLLLGTGCQDAADPVDPVLTPQDHMPGGAVTLSGPTRMVETRAATFTVHTAANAPVVLIGTLSLARA